MSNVSDPKAQKLQLSFDYRIITYVLVAAIAVMLFVWKPWSVEVTDRTIDVTGIATVTARPDEFVFYPSYQFKNTDRDAALEALTAKNDAVVSGLKKIGVPDKGIKTNSNSWSYPVYSDGIESMATYTLQFTVTVDDDKLAQKVQDYLVGTTPSGTITPQANFSDVKRKELENQARDEATKDARAKADQSAKNLGFKVAAVKAVNDGSGFGGYPYPTIDYAEGLKADDSRSSLTIQPGENDLSYTVTVTYFIH